MRATVLLSRLLPLVLLLPPATPARAQSILGAIRADQWAEADALAAAAPDPLARKLVQFYRLLSPGGGHAAEIAAFMADSPDWPQQALLSRRLQEALAADKDDRTVLAICQSRPPQAVPSLLRCADAAAGTDTPGADTPARRAWLTGIADPVGEAAFMHRWGATVTPDDQWRRFDRLAWTESPAANGPAGRQILRLLPAQRGTAEVRLALRRDIPLAAAMFQALPAAAHTADPALVLELARWYRRAGQDRDAATTWTTMGAAAEAAAAPERRTAFWDERNLLARRLLRLDEPALAYAVAALPTASPEGAIDQAFLSGWIALRRLNRPADALAAFTRLATLSPAAITQARAHYWLGRTHDALRERDTALAEYVQGAAWPTTYYGQLSALAAGDSAAGLDARVAAAHDPAWDAERAMAFLSRDNARVAVLLAAWGDARRARPFLARLDELAADGTDRAMAARLALGLGLPDQAVAIARRAGRDGVMLPGAGWPPAAVPPADEGVERAVVLGLIRQESSFDVAATSPVGARGLMQLMPATAAVVARKLGVAADVGALTADPGYNMRLGTRYFGDLLARFGQAIPLAVAGYNAGPGRVVDWMGVSDASVPDMIDWIETIPFTETRNYVQRVIENIVIYRAQAGVALPHPVQAGRG